MPARVDVPYHGEFKTSRSESEVFKILSQVESFIPKHLPGMESLKADAQGNYLWKFEELRYQSYSIQIQCVTKIGMKPPGSIEFMPVKRDDVGTAKGGWKIEKQGDGSKVTFDLALELVLPVPRLLGAMAGPIARSELTKVFNEFLKNVENSL